MTRICFFLALALASGGCSVPVVPGRTAPYYPVTNIVDPVTQEVPDVIVAP